MLVVSPHYSGKGIGPKLAELCISKYGVRYVDVNDQNPQTVGFYGNVGPEMLERCELDERGDP